MKRNQQLTTQLKTQLAMGGNQNFVNLLEFRNSNFDHCLRIDQIVPHFVELYLSENYQSCLLINKYFKFYTKYRKHKYIAMNTSLYLPTEMTVGSIIFLIIYVIFMTDFIIKSKDYSISEGNLLHQDDGYNLELPSPLGLPETWQIEFSYSGTDQVQLFGIASDDTLQPNQHRESLNYITLERKDTNTVWLTVMHDGKHKIQIDIDTKFKEISSNR